MQSVHQDQILKKKISQASYLTLLLLLSKRCPAKALKTAIKASLEKSYSKMSLTVELRWQQCLLIPGCKRIGFHYPANISKHRSHDDTRHSFGPKTRWNWNRNSRVVAVFLLLSSLYCSTNYIPPRTQFSPQGHSSQQWFRIFTKLNSSYHFALWLTPLMSSSHWLLTSEPNDAPVFFHCCVLVWLWPV